MFIEVSLAPNCHWTYTKTPLGYASVAPCPGDTVDIVPQDQSFHTLQQAIDRVDVRVGHPKIKDVDLDGS